MKNLFVFHLFFALCIEVSAQLSVQDRLQSSFIEAENYLSLFSPESDKANYDCPPKMIKQKVVADSTMGFLSASMAGFESEKTLYLSRLMQDNCKAYYNIRVLDNHFGPIYRKLLEEFDIPKEYEILPLLISSSNPILKIEGDRAGLWQLSYLNARRFGLRVDDEIDDRFDPTRATMASIQYLLFLEEYFEGDKLLVLCAFYSSLPYVNKIKLSLERYSEAAFVEELNDELKHFLIYYHSWYEWNKIFKESKLSDPIQKAEKEMKNIIFKDTISIDVLAEFLGLETFFVRSINPVWVGDWVDSNSEKYPFRLPKEKADFVLDHYEGFLSFHSEKLKNEEEELVALKKRMKDDIPDPNRYKAISYKVKSGDVLGLIAQRYGVKVSSIKKWNKLSSDRINIGQVLVLYVPKSKGIEASDEVHEIKEEVSEEKIELKRKEPKAGKGTYTTYTVQQGESLWLIARKFPGVSSENIMEWNGINDKIQPGQELKIYEGD